MIPDLQASQTAKLKLIDSIAKSQSAMARILDSLADITECDEHTASHLARNIEVLTRYQREMARTVCGISLHRIYHGTPTEPWIMDLCYPANVAAKGAQGDER